MSISAHIHTKHEIEYSGPRLTFQDEALEKWFRDHNVEFYESHEGYEWEILKEDIDWLSGEDCMDAEEYGMDIDELWGFINDLQLIQTSGRWLYVSWF